MNDMPFYEHVFLARQDLTAPQVEALTEGLTRVVSDNKGKVVGQEYWGLRTIAYRIAKNRKAHYVMLNLDAPAAAVAELERQVRLNEDIVRFMTVRVDALGTEPSPMLRKSDRSESRDMREGGREGGRDGAPRAERPRREPRAA
jgi:small subunit ribosomal protein S6